MSDGGLTPRERRLLCEVFERHGEVESVRLFGSRAKGVHRPNSDIDLAVWGNLDTTQLARLAGELDELPLPYQFDLQVYPQLHHRELREHIDRVGIPLYEADRVVRT